MKECYGYKCTSLSLLVLRNSIAVTAWRLQSTEDPQQKQYRLVKLFSCCDPPSDCFSPRAGLGLSRDTCYCNGNSLCLMLAPWSLQSAVTEGCSSHLAEMQPGIGPDIITLGATNTIKLQLSLLSSLDSIILLIPSYMLFAQENLKLKTTLAEICIAVML